MEKPTVASLFSSIGGIDLAFRQAGFEIIWANEKDPSACITYRNNLSDRNLVEGDILDIDEHQVPKASILVAGFPCQSFSIMGYQRGFKDCRGNLFFEIARIAQAMQPEVIFLENVRNLIYHDHGRTFITIFNTLAHMGYWVKYAVQNAKTHGNIPQERNRTFIVAFLDIDRMNRFSFPDAIERTVELEDILDRSVRHDERYYYREENRYYRKLDQNIVDETGIYRIDDSGVAKRKYKISPTLKTNMGTYPDRVPIIRDDYGLRKITPYECLALQGFPKDYVMKNISLADAYKQCGNTVCVPVVRRIAENLYDSLRTAEPES